MLHLLQGEPSNVVRRPAIARRVPGIHSRFLVWLELFQWLPLSPASASAPPITATAPKIILGLSHGRPFLHCPVATARYSGSRRSFRPPARRPGGLQVSETFLETLYMRPARAHPPAAVAPTLRMLPCAAAHGVPAPASLAPFFDPLGSSGCPLCAPHAPTATVLTQRSLPRPRRALRTCARIVGSISAPQSIFGTLLRRRAHAALAPAAVALTHSMLPRPRRTSLGPFLCPSRFSGPPSLRIVYPHVSCHMWHAPVRRPPLLRSQPPLARPLRVPTVAPIQRTLARPDPWN
ncbi:hypothetical protein B0H14DRAFT_3904482 [Mycena olivaceomarginata]|nr:hypothetical protein B0H14DRAFT_3904482 [Mycena olivaceomarginata]